MFTKYKDQIIIKQNIETNLQIEQNYRAKNYNLTQKKGLEFSIKISFNNYSPRPS